MWEIWMEDVPYANDPDVKLQSEFKFGNAVLGGLRPKLPSFSKHDKVGRSYVELMKVVPH